MSSNNKGISFFNDFCEKNLWNFESTSYNLCLTQYALCLNFELAHTPL